MNGTHVCVMSMEDEEFNLANGIGPCDCSDPENFDFEDEGRFFDTEGYLKCPKNFVEDTFCM